MNECLPLLPRLKSIFVLNFKGKPLLCLQGSFRRGRRRCDRAGTETWQGKFLIQQGLFLKTSKDMFWFCFKVRSWEVSVADRALCSCRGKGSRSSSQLGPGGQAGVKQHRAAEVAAWTRSFPRLRLRLRLVQFPPDPAPHCTPRLSPGGAACKLIQLSREIKAGAWPLLHREPVLPQRRAVGTSGYSLF